MKATGNISLGIPLLISWHWNGKPWPSSWLAFRLQNWHQCQCHKEREREGETGSKNIYIYIYLIYIYIYISNLYIYIYLIYIYIYIIYSFSLQIFSHDGWSVDQANFQRSILKSWRFLKYDIPLMSGVPDLYQPGFCLKQSWVARIYFAAMDSQAKVAKGLGWIGFVCNLSMANLFCALK